MSDRWKTGLTLLGVLLVPIVPFIIFSSQLEPWAEQWVAESQWSERPLVFGAVVVGFLVADIILPIPSSVVCTVAGSVLGAVVGGLICWLGLNLSALLGILVAKYFGRPVARRFSSEEKLLETSQLVDQYGAWALVICRAIPVLAEASVLFVGLYRMDPWKFWPPIIAANLGLSVAYCVMGEIAQQQQWLATALAISVSIPVIAMLSWIWVVKRKRSAA